MKDITNTDFGDFGHGCSNIAGGGRTCGDSLSPQGNNRFTYQGTGYNVHRIYLHSGNLNFGLDQVIPNGIRQNATLHVGHRAFSFASASYPSIEAGFLASWSAPGLSWSINDSVRLRLVINTNLAPHAPANVLVYRSGDGSYLIVEWSAPDPDADPPVTGYDVAYKLSTSSNWTDAGYDSSQGGFGPPKPLSLYKVLSGLTIGSTYDARVRAKNANGNSAWSTGQGTLSATTKDNNLSGLVLTASATSTGTFTEVKLLSNFRATQTDYFAVVADGLDYLKVTPTKRHTGASIKVNGTAVTSGSPSNAFTFASSDLIIVAVTAAYDSATTPWPDREYKIYLRRSDNRPGYRDGFNESGSGATGRDADVFDRPDDESSNEQEQESPAPESTPAREPEASNAVPDLESDPLPETEGSASESGSETPDTAPESESDSGSETADTPSGYDADNDGAISKSEYRQAAWDYSDGKITYLEMLEIAKEYLASSA